MQLILCLGVAVFLALLCAACQSNQHEYWWEEGYPYSEGGALVGRRGASYSTATGPSASLPSASGTGASAVLTELRRTTVPGFTVQDEESLTVVVDALRTTTGLPLVVDPAAEAAALDEGALFDLVLTNPLSARHVLDLIVEQAGPDVSWTIRHEAILVTTRAKTRGRVVTQAHDIHTLVASRTDFIAPRLDRIRLIDDLEDEDGGGPFGSQEQSEPRFEADDLVTLVQENIAVGTWEDQAVSITAENGILFVVHTPEVQARVSRFLASLAGF